jgi:hypothetical protein
LVLTLKFSSVDAMAIWPNAEDAKAASNAVFFNSTSTRVLLRTSFLVAASARMAASSAASALNTGWTSLNVCAVLYRA